MLKKIALLGAMALANGAAAQNANSILVLDGSGSMWGQIDGVAKISIAQDVVGGLMTSLPQDQALGLTVYGHRKKGDCSDIETLVNPGLDTRGSIVEAVNGIQPKGKTPMTDAVIMAAKALRYTEEEATVVLISDGIETCNADPCGAARALEQAGVNFTAHVVGFGVADKEALAQMQCIADETGGQFVTAANASELSNALNEVVAAPAPEPVMTTVTISARLDSEDGALIADPMVWSIAGRDGAIDTNDNPLVIDLEAGSYDINATWSAEETKQAKQFIATGAAREITLVFETPLPIASIIAPESAVAGSQIEVAWTGPDGDDDYIGIGLTDAKGAAQWDNYTYTKEGSPLNLLVPPTPGDYQITYFTGDNRAPLANVPITIDPVIATITAPNTAQVGQSIEVAWTGPNYEGDYIGVGTTDAKGAKQWENYAYTSDGETLQLLMPPTPGDYVITYFLGQDRKVLVNVPITLGAVETSIIAPNSAAAGSEIEIGWTGPDYADDYIAVGPKGASGSAQWKAYAYTNKGNPAKITLPDEPGEYVIQYFLAQDRTPLAAQPLLIE